MGVLINGKWQRDDKGFKVDPSKQAGTFFTPHDQIEVEGGERYVLYVAAGCPWAARAWMACCVTGMDKGVIKVCRVFPANQEDGWFFKPASESEHRVVHECLGRVEWDPEEPVSGGQFTHLHQVYVNGQEKNVTGRVTVPLLYDTKTNTCISSESEDILSIMLGRFAPLHIDPVPSMYPSQQREAIHQQIKILTQEVNSIVYGIHFSKTQSVFEEKMNIFYARLEKFEAILNSRPWILEGTDQPSALDLVLFATIIRHDIAYGTRFRMTQYTIRENFPGLWHHCCRVYRLKGIRRAIQFQGILCMYYKSLPLVKKAGITTGPLLTEYASRLSKGGRGRLGVHQLSKSHTPASKGLAITKLWPLIAVFALGCGVGAVLSRSMK